MKQKPNPQFVAEFQQVIKDYQWDNKKEKDMVAMYAADRKDFREVLSLYKKGDWGDAATKARRMDTGARDYIPQGIWDQLAEYMY